MKDASATPSIASRFERLPRTSYQMSIFLIIATAWFFNSMGLAMITFLLGSIKAEFALSTEMTGLLGSASFLGMLIGAASSGCSVTASADTWCSSQNHNFGVLEACSAQQQMM